MALPQTIRVKLSSEAAESISLTRVVVQDLPAAELIEHVLGIAGKDIGRIQEILLRGSLITGASRFRWVGWRVEPEELSDVLALFPDPDPSIAFSAVRCSRAVLRGGSRLIEITREAGTRKGVFQKDVFWESLMATVAGSARYAGYSYRDRADHFVSEIGLEEAQRLRTDSHLVRYSILRDQIRATPFHAADLYVER